MQESNQTARELWQQTLDKYHPILTRFIESCADGKGPSYLNVRNCEMAAKGARLFLEMATAHAQDENAAAAANYAFGAGCLYHQLVTSMKMAENAVRGHKDKQVKRAIVDRTNIKKKGKRARLVTKTGEAWKRELAKGKLSRSAIAIEVGSSVTKADGKPIGERMAYEYWREYANSRKKSAARR